MRNFWHAPKECFSGTKNTKSRKFRSKPIAYTMDINKPSILVFEITFSYLVLWISNLAVFIIISFPSNVSIYFNILKYPEVNATKHRGGMETLAQIVWMLWAIFCLDFRFPCHCSLPCRFHRNNLEFLNSVKLELRPIVSNFLDFTPKFLIWANDMGPVKELVCFV